MISPERLSRRVIKRRSIPRELECALPDDLHPVLRRVFASRQVSSSELDLSLAAMIPVSKALQTTGCTDLIADFVNQYTGRMPAWSILVLLMVITMCLSDVINNAATALVMAPIGVGIALQMNVSPDPFLMTVAVGASCAFLTPIGHQCNALILGPGGYRFGDYWRMGLPLEILIVAIGTPLILHFWPL